MALHALSPDEVLRNYNVNEKDGLSDEQVHVLREKYGTNSLMTIKPKPKWLVIFEQFNNPFIYILIAAAIVNGIVADLKDTFVIAAVVTLNTFIGYIQEQRASDALQALKKMTSPIARVIRNSIQITIPTTDVVCGDIIVLESGMRVPADARLIESQNLLIDESMLTGESFSSEKRFDAVISSSAPLGDRITMVYSGTIVQKGRGLAVVTAVGNHTEFGKISEKVAEAEETISPLQIQIGKLSKLLTFTILGAVIAIFIVGALSGKEVLQMFLTSIGLAVSAIPEGLPVSVTITLTFGISLMAKHKAVVKRLAAVETLGSTNIICTDKTGTLTKNQMTVTKVYIDGKEFDFSGGGYTDVGDVIEVGVSKKVNADSYPTLKLSAMISTICSETTIQKDNDEYTITGDPTEAALMLASKKLKYECNDFKRWIDIPFESENQLMAVKVLIDGKIHIFAKGAPEKIIERCTNMIDINGNIKDLDIELLKKKVADFSNNGLRVLALAKSDSCFDCESSLTEKCDSCPLDLDTLINLDFVGFSCIQDAVRPEAIEAVTECHNAGVRVIMITGDHAQTAKAIAKTVGIGNEAMALSLGIGKQKDPTVVTGNELDNMTDTELFNRVNDIDVYARVAPQHKYRIVKQLQAQKNIVAMTGDGVNDAPALKQADIGVAMGTGTDVARDSAHIVLMDDNFATIVHAVRRGRIILQNLQHILLYILCTSLGGVLTIASSVILGFPLPILPAQLLWINLVTDGTSTFPLAFEQEHGNVMAFPPRKKDEPLISSQMIYRIIFAGLIMMIGTIGVFVLSLENIYNPNPDDLAKAQTMAFCTLAFFQIWNVQNSRSLDRSILFNLPYPSRSGKLEAVPPQKNPVLLAVMILAIVLQISAVLLPFMNDLMRTVPLNFNEWLIAGGLPFSIIVLVELIKFIEAYINKLRWKKANIK